MAIWNLDSDGDAYDTNGNQLVSGYRGVHFITSNGFVMHVESFAAVEKARQYIRDFVEEKHRIDIERGD